MINQLYPSVSLSLCLILYLSISIIHKFQLLVQLFFICNLNLSSVEHENSAGFLWIMTSRKNYRNLICLFPVIMYLKLCALKVIHQHTTFYVIDCIRIYWTIGYTILFHNWNVCCCYCCWCCGWCCDCIMAWYVWVQ